MTNKILIDEAVVRQALEALDKLVRFESDSWELGSCRVAGQAIKALREALAEQPAQSTADKSKLETVPANGGLLPAQQEPSPEGVLFAVEEAIRNGGCFWQIEDAFNEYESKRKAAHEIAATIRARKNT